MSDKNQKAQEIKEKVEGALQGVVSLFEKAEASINGLGNGLRDKFAILKGTEGILLIFALWTIGLQIYFYQYKFVDYEQPLLLSVGPIAAVAVIRVVKAVLKKKKTAVAKPKKKVGKKVAEETQKEA